MDVPVPMVAVTGSENVAEIGYDSANLNLYVRFLNRALYQYYGVPLEEHAALMAAASKGSYIYHHIGRRYRFVQLVPPEKKK